MIIYILLAAVVGIMAGIITGLVPGIHINLIASLILSASVFLLQYSSQLVLAVFIVSMAITHTITDFIPSCFFSAPDSGDTALSVLPAHRLLLKGRGYEAVRLTAIGSLGGLVMVLILTPVFLIIVRPFYNMISAYIGYILVASVLFLIFKEKSRLWATIIFFMAGVLGLGVLNLPNLNDPLFPMLSGLFGTSILVLSIKNKTKIPNQNYNVNKIDKKEFGKSVSGGIIASSLVGFLPGIGSAQAAIIASSLFKKISMRGTLILIGGINTIVMSISFIALYSIEKARNGAVLVVSKILGQVTIDNLFLFLGVSLVVAIVAFFITLKMAKMFSSFINKVNYGRICLSIFFLIVGLVTIISGFLGLFVLTVSTFVGMIPALRGIGRNHLMGCLILPVILYFLLP